MGVQGRQAKLPPQQPSLPTSCGSSATLTVKSIDPLSEGRGMAPSFGQWKPRGSLQGDFQARFSSLIETLEDTHSFLRAL